jgi:hypothetical protein
MKTAIIPKGNLPKDPILGLTVVGLSQLQEVMDYLG